MSHESQLAMALVQRYEHLAAVDAGDGAVLHAGLREGAISEYFNPRAGGNVWVSHTLHVAADRVLHATAGPDGVQVYRSLHPTSAEAAAAALLELCGEDHHLRLAESEPPFEFLPEQGKKPAPVIERLEAALKQLYSAASQAGLAGCDSELAAAHALLRELQQARAAKSGPGVDGHTPGVWHGEFYQGDHGASLAVCSKDHGVIALVPFAQLDDTGAIDADALNAENAPREPFDLPNLRRLLACVNACEGMSTSMLEALRPDVEPFVDDCGRNFVVFSRYEFELGEGAGFWSNEEGWVVLEDATRFTQADTMTMGLPQGAIGATWMDWAEAKASCRPEELEPKEGMRP